MNTSNRKPPYAINVPHAYQHAGGKRTHEQFMLEFNGMWGDVYSLAEGVRYEKWDKKMRIWDATRNQYFLRNANAILRGHGNDGDKRGQARDEQRAKISKLI